MSSEPSPKRRYDASRRQATAEGSRARILQAARLQFLEHGFERTTLARIASEADVSVQTVTKAYANKAGLLKAIFDVALVGDEDPSPLAERDAIVAMHAEPDARRKLELYAIFMARVLPHTGPIQLVAREAIGDPGVRALVQQINEGRLAGMGAFAANLLATGQLRDNLKANHVRDVLWTYSSPELYELLVVQRGWTATQHQEFLEEATVAALLGPAPR